MLKIEKINETQPVYDITVEGNHNFFANGILVHNCQEITLPTIPMASYETEVYSVAKADALEEIERYTNQFNVTNIKIVPLKELDVINLEITRDSSEIALCTLAAINLGNVKNLDDLEGSCRTAVRALDSLLSYQDYMVTAAKTSTDKYRPLGIGITNLAYYLAKNGYKYDDAGAYVLMHDTMEAISFYCIKASIELAKEKGRCPGFEDTKWADGMLPIHRYNKNVDKITNPKLNLDWKWLGEQLAEHGIRNATLLAMMPAESSSRIFNSTNGVEPVRSLITTKMNKSHITKQIVPEYNRLKNKYDLLWEMRSMDGIIKMMAVIQKFTCQSISTNLSYNPEHYPNGEIPMSVLVGDLLKANFYGVKTLYYNNIRDGADDVNVADAKVIEVAPVEVAKVDDDSSCDACSI